MKKLYATLGFLFCLLITYSETLVNLAWKDTIGHPTVKSKYFAGSSDVVNGLFYIVGNTFVTGEEENFFVAKIDASDGNVIWYQDYNGYSNSRDFGLDIVTKGDYVYLTGLSWDSTSSKSTITTFQLSATTGDTVWTARYTGSYNGYNAAADIAVDDTGNVFIAGSEQTGSLNFGMIVLKYDSFGNQLWAGRYDSTMMYDAAVALALDPGKNLAVTGFSGNGFSSWDFVTVGYDPQTGTQQAYNRYGNGSGNFSQPVGISKDDMDQTYIAGTAAHSGQTDMKLIAYDSTLSQLWVHKWGDSTLNEEAVTMEDDLGGNILVGGTQTKANGGKDMVLLKYDKNSGSLLWSKTISAVDPTKEASLKAISNDGQGGSYLTGRMHNGNDFDIVTAHIDADGNLEWLKTYSRGANTNDDPDDVEYDDDGGVVITATSMGGDTVYLMLGYNQVKAFIPNDSLNPNTAYAFYENRGQITFNDSLHTQADSILYYTNAGSPQLYVADKRLSYVMAHENTDSVPYVDTTYRIDMQFTGTHERVYDPKMNFDDAKTNAFLNYYLGYIPEPVTNVEGHNRIVRKRVYEHIDWEICSTVEGIKNYFIVGRNGDVSDIQLKYSGADSISIVGDSMQLFIAGNYIQFAPLTAYSVDTAGTATAVGVHFTALGGNEFGFAVDSFGEDDILVVEERLGGSRATPPSDNMCWSTYYGGAFDEQINDVKTGGGNIVYATGTTSSGNFPATMAQSANPPSGSHSCGFLIKFDQNDTRKWATYFGGSTNTKGGNIAIKHTGEPFVCGVTEDHDFPMHPITGASNITSTTGFINSFSFLARFNPSDIAGSGGLMTWSTYFDGDQHAIEFSGDYLYMGGDNAHSVFPYTPSSTGNVNGNIGYGSIVKYDNDLNIVWATRLGDCSISDIAVTPTGKVYFVGFAADEPLNPNNFNVPIVHPLGSYTQPFQGLYTDGLILEFSNLDVLEYSTFMSGVNIDALTGVSVGIIGDDLSYEVYLCGYTYGSDFPTLDATGSTYFKGTSYTGGTGIADGVFVVLNSDNTRNYATYYGGTRADRPNSIVAYGSTTYITGFTQSTNLDVVTPTGYFTQPTNASANEPISQDAFIASYYNHQLRWSTYLGGKQLESGLGITMDQREQLYVAGLTNSPQNAANPSEGYPLKVLTGAYNQADLNLLPVNPNQNIPSDGFITRFCLQGNYTSVLSLDSEKPFLVYPNPSSNSIHIIKQDANVKIKGIKIFNTLGQKVGEVPGDEETINISGLTAGIYFIRIETEAFFKTIKFIKE